MAEIGARLVLVSHRPDDGLVSDGMTLDEGSLSSTIVNLRWRGNEVTPPWIVSLIRTTQKSFMQYVTQTKPWKQACRVPWLTVVEAC
jgi:hypothetical protein